MTTENQTTTKWVLDSTHSELGFKIKHLMISNVSGLFQNFSAEVSTIGTDFSTAQISFTGEMASISTRNEQRDAHLRSSDFFAIEQYPQFSFTSSKIEPISEDDFTLFGELTLKGVSKPVSLQVSFNGIHADPWGGERAGFVVQGKINRSDWGINFNSALETGGLMLGEEVKINSDIQLVKSAQEG